MVRLGNKPQSAGQRYAAAGLLAVVWLLAALPALAQTPVPAIQLTVQKTFGFNNGSQIQGSFRAEVTGPANLTAVTFTLDGASWAQVSAPPFTLDFNTDAFAPGWHTLGASGRTADGQTLTATDRRFQFLSPAESQAATQRILVPILAVVGVLVAVGLGSQLFFAMRGSRGRTALPLGAARSYGLWGGAICPKCQRPFSRHWWGLNALPGQKFDRCDHCGKWSLVGRASPEQLAKAQAAEPALGQPEAPQPELSSEEKLKRDVDASRYFDEH